jgi:glycosyltransferase involved in cell wall biosynthesis
MKSLGKSRFILYPSRWASESSHLYYNISIEKIYQLPFGPCIPDDLIDRYYSIKSVSFRKEIVIIYVSADWKRKNGDKAIDICHFFITSGIKTRLIMIGQIPEHVKHINFVDYRGFIRKSDPAQLAELCRAYHESHFLLVPTIAEAFGIVFSEAQAFGIPPIAHDVGGTASAIVADNTGLLLPVGAPPEMFGEKIIRYANDPKLYSDLSQRCREQYLQRANWRRWSELILQLSHHKG